MKTFEEVGINLNGREGQFKTQCPKCSSKRTKNPGEDCLSINTELGLYKCHHCGWSGALEGFKRLALPSYKDRDYATPVYRSEEWELSETAIEFFAKRGISETTLRLNQIGSKMGKLAGEECEIVSFPYIKDKIVNVGYRSTESKTFRFFPQAEMCFYGMQNLFTADCLNTKQLVICEGQIDLLSFYEAGITNVVSVPQGSPFQEGKTNTPKLEYLEDPFFMALAPEFDEIIIATDNDYAGKALAQELANRLGVERCSRFYFEEGKKDANEVLTQLGREAVVGGVLKRTPMLQGLVGNIQERMLNYYNKGFDSGLTTGIEAFDEVFTLGFPYITLVTGIPEIGKSMFLDNILLGYAKEHGLHTTIFSPETKPMEFHVARLVSIKTGQSIGSPDDIDRISYNEYMDAVKWVDRHFTFLEPKANSLQEIIALFKASILKNGSKICVIDPFSRIRIEGENERMFIRNMLNELSEFCTRHRVHLFIVAHPTKPDMAKPKNPTEIKDVPIVTPYDIKGAGEWFDSSDFIISLWRTRQVDNAPLRVYVLKSKYHHLAKSYKYAELKLSNFRLK
jgi:twinkle protein